MDPKIVLSLKKDFGAFAFLNLLNLFNFVNEGVSSGEKVASLIHILFGLISIYFIFTVGNLFPKNPNLIKAFVLFALLFTVIKPFVISINIIWTIVFVIASVYLIIKLNNASKSLQSVVTQ